MAQPLIGITGAGGVVGSLAAGRLADQGAELRLILRDAARAPRISGVDLATAQSYGATDEMADALKGVDTLLLVSARESVDQLEQQLSAVDAAAAAGVSRIVYTSFCGASRDATYMPARAHHATEQAIIQSGMAYAFQRQNLYSDLLPRLADEDGVISGPAGDGFFAPVTRSDVADVAVALLTDEGLDGRTFDVSGPERISMAHLANRLAAMTGLFFEYKQEPIEEAWSFRSNFGAPDWQVEAWVTTYLAIAEGELDLLTDAVERLTGHPATSFETFVTENPASWAHVMREAR